MLAQLCLHVRCLWSVRGVVCDCFASWVSCAIIVLWVRLCVVWQTDGCTPLYAASGNGHVKVVRALVGAGAAVNQAAVRDDCDGCWCSVVRE
jgi:hypothetical protein